MYPQARGYKGWQNAGTLHTGQGWQESCQLPLGMGSGCALSFAMPLAALSLVLALATAGGS